MKKYNQAYYLMDHKGIGPNAPKTSFDYDYRYSDEKTTQANISSGQRVIRKFQSLTDGKAVCMFRMNIDGENTDGTYYSFINRNEEEVLRIETTEGNFVCGDTVISPTKKGENKAKIEIDADNGTILVSVNCSEKKAFSYDASFDLSGFVYGIKCGFAVSVYLHQLVMHVNYAVNESFMYADRGTFPEDFEVVGDIVCGSPNGRNNYAYVDAKAGKNYSVTKHFDKQQGVTGFEAMILLPDGADGAYMELLSGDKSVYRVVSKGGCWVSASGEKLMNFTKNVWQWLRVEADPVNGKAFVRIDTKNAGTHSLDFKAEYFDGIRIGIDAEVDTVMHFTDILVYNYDKPDDYVPEPKPLDTGDYVIGMNVCNLWREGGHNGWDAISTLPDHEPIIGYYDEGIEETADWEIKFMLEHGIKFQHPCWYCPQWDISEPLYPRPMGAINRGLLASRYTDMMKFTFMWENTSGQVKNFEQFKEFIWPYWKEYYFSNPNFLVIDNKPIMTTYAIGLYVNGFGGIEGGKKALEFMNEDIKTLGFDGIIMLFHDAHERSMEVLGPVAEMGAAGLYGYHWNDLGKDPEHQKKRMLNNRDALGFYVFPTLAMGFNNLGWGGHKHGVSTLEQFRDVAKWMKNDFLPAYGDSWKSKYFFVATWNEYGEGHFVIPSTLHGYGYLDVIAEEFGSKDFDYKLNIIPTENQKSRICHMYVQDRNLIKPIREVDERNKHIPTETVIKWDMSDKETAAKFIPSNDILDYSIDGGVIHGRRNGGRGDISLKLDNISINLDDVDYLHIRMRSTNENNSMWFGYVVNDKIGNVRWVYTEYTKSENYSDFYVPKSLFTIKEGIITALDICPMRLGWGDFDIALIEFLQYTEDDRPADVYIDGKKQDFDFEPESRNGDLYVTINPQTGILKTLNVIYEASRKNSMVRLLGVDKDMRFTYGLDHFTLNNRSCTLPDKLTSKDGLPVLPLQFFAELLGYKVEVVGKDYHISTK